MQNLGIQNKDTEGLLPKEYAKEIITQLEGQSVLLTHGKKKPMATSEYVQPVLESTPDAYFVEDGGLIPTSKAKWGNVNLKASTLAVIVPIQKSLLEDSSYDIYSTIVEEGTRKLGMAYDNAGLFGVGKPSAWSESVYELATKVSNNFTISKNKDMTVAVPELAQKIGTQGFSVDGFVTPKGTCWYLRGLRDTTGQPIYSLDIQNKDSGLLYGFPISEFSSPNFEAKKIKMVMADWSKILVGVRRDVRVEKLDQAVITDEAGKVVYNLAQSDAVAFKLSMRLGFAIANPVTSSQEDASKRAPVGIITGEGSASSVTSS